MWESSIIFLQENIVDNMFICIVFFSLHIVFFYYYIF
jgi:hypothetical protein